VTCERLSPGEYPKLPQWEKLGFTLKPLGLKPPSNLTQDYGRWKDPSQKHQKDWPFVFKHVIAVSTMLRGTSLAVIDSFVRYHWAIGVNHIFLFFDDAEDPAIQVAKDYAGIAAEDVMDVSLSVFVMNDSWWECAMQKSRFFVRREKSDKYEEVCRGHEKYRDVESRRTIAIDIAILEAHARKVDWFVHLDIDECLYVPQRLGNSVRQYLGSQPRAVQCVRLWNHEAIPENFDCKDWFRESTTFMLNKNHCCDFQPPREYDALLRKREGKELEPVVASKDLSWFRKALARIHIRRQAQAQKLNLPLPEGPVLPDVSGFELPLHVKQDQMLETFFHFTSSSSGRVFLRLDPKLRPALPLGDGYVADSGALIQDWHQANGPDEAVVLHYPNAGFAHWMRKYETLGPLPFVRDGVEYNRFHVTSSQIVPKLDKKSLELFYRTFIMQNEHNEVAYMAEYGLVQRFNGVRRVLEELDKPAEEQLPGHASWYAPNGMRIGR